MEDKGTQINHLCFVDDIIIFTSTMRMSLQLIMKTISDDENISDRLHNKDKRFFMVTKHTDDDIVVIIKEENIFSRKDSPIKYLGCCPLYIRRQRIIY